MLFQPVHPSLFSKMLKAVSNIFFFLRKSINSEVMLS